MRHLTAAELQAGLDEIRRSPTDGGVLRLIVRRPRVNAREVLGQAELDCRIGLVGDTWPARGSTRTPDGTPHPDMQLNVMNSRVIELLAGEKEHWPLAGDQLFVDLDLSETNLPPGTRLALGSATIEVTAQPHTGCQKFVARFGLDAMNFVNSSVGRELRLRGLNARVVQPGSIRVGEVVRKLRHTDECARLQRPQNVGHHAQISIDPSADADVTLVVTSVIVGGQLTRARTSVRD